MEGTMESSATNCQTLLREAENAEHFGTDVQKMTAMLRAHWRQDHNRLTQTPGIIKAPLTADWRGVPPIVNKGKLRSLWQSLKRGVERSNRTA